MSTARIHCDADGQAEFSASILIPDDIVEDLRSAAAASKETAVNATAGATGRNLICIVLDKSGSMSGRPWKQVQEAASSISERLEEFRADPANAAVEVDVSTILYCNDAMAVASPDKVSRISAGGSTSFEAAFKELSAEISRRAHAVLTARAGGAQSMARRLRGTVGSAMRAMGVESGTASPAEVARAYDRVTVCFMTDGQDTSVRSRATGIDFDASQAVARRAMRKFADSDLVRAVPLTAHVVGFSADHDLGFLTELAAIGTGDGMYRFAEPSDGPTELRGKLDELFAHVIETGAAHGRGCAVRISVACEALSFADAAAGGGIVEAPVDIAAISETSSETEGAAGPVKVDVALWGAMRGSTMSQFLSAGACIAEICVGTVGDATGSTNTDNDNHTATASFATIMTPCTVCAPQPGDAGHAAFEARAIQQRANVLFAEMTAAIDATRASAAPAAAADLADTLRASWHADVAALDARLAEARDFPVGVRTRASRVEVSEAIAETAGRVQRMLGTSAKIAAREMLSVAEIAKIKDLRHEHVFARRRRNALQDRRTAAFAGRAEAIAGALAALPAGEDDDAVAVQFGGSGSAPATAAREFFHCDLSTADIFDVLGEEDPERRDEVLGIALAVQRSELAVDDPTLIRVHHVSSSIVERTAVQDAVRYGLRTSGAIATHGGFAAAAADADADAAASIPHASVDRARREINAFLPLYVCPSHWERVKILLPLDVAYYATLDPTAYAASQRDVMFTILGTMLSRAGPGISEREVAILVAFWRTCVQLARDVPGCRASERADAFVAGPAGRFRDVCGNLATAIGLAAVRCATASDGAFDVSTFAEALRIETIRRGCDAAVSAVCGDADADCADDDAGSGSAGGVSRKTVLGVARDMLRDLGFRSEAIGEAPSRDREERTGAGTAPSAGAFVSRVTRRGFGFNPQGSVASAAAAQVDTITEDDLRAALPPRNTGVRKPNITQVKKAAAWAKAVLRKTPLGFAPKASTLVPERRAAAEDIFATRDTGGAPHAVPGLAAEILGRGVGDRARDARAGPIAFMRLIERGVVSAPDLDGTHGGVAPAAWADALRAEIAEERSRARAADDDNDGDGDAAIVAAAIALQCFAHRRNAAARAAVDAGTHWDFAHASTRAGNARACLAHYHAEMDRLCAEAHGAFWTRQAQLRAVAKALLAPDDWSFVGFLAAGFTDHCSAFHLLVELLANRALPIPARREKILLVHLGKIDGEFAFLNNGNAWLPDAGTRAAFAAALGADAYDAVLIEARANVTEYKYRGWPADMPNRHGHSNSNPSEWALSGRFEV